MLKSVATMAGAVLAVMALMLLPLRNNEAVAESGPLLVNAVDYDVVPGQVDNFLAAAQGERRGYGEGAGLSRFNVTVSQKDPNHVFIFEVYDNAAASKRIWRPNISRNTRPSPKTWSPSVRRRPLWSVAMNIKGM